jgi:hypothetical protein
MRSPPFLDMQLPSPRQNTYGLRLSNNTDLLGNREYQKISSGKGAEQRRESEGSGYEDSFVRASRWITETSILQ